MRRSKLESYEDVLIALARKPLTVDALAYKCKMDCVILNHHLDFLLKNDLVQEATCNKIRLYELTRRGAAIYKTLSIAKRLEKLQATANNTSEPLTATSKQNQRKPTRMM